MNSGSGRSLAAQGHYAFRTRVRAVAQVLSWAARTGPGGPERRPSHPAWHVLQPSGAWCRDSPSGGDVTPRRADTILVPGRRARHWNPAGKHSCSPLAFACLTDRAQRRIITQDDHAGPPPRPCGRSGTCPRQERANAEAGPCNRGDALVRDAGDSRGHPFARRSRPVEDFPEPGVDKPARLPSSTPSRAEPSRAEPSRAATSTSRLRP